MSPTQEKTYTTSELSTLAKVTTRQLQWWDEKKILRATHTAHKRTYTKAQALEALIIADLLKRGVTMHLIRLRVLPKLRGHAKPQPNFYLVIETKAGAVRCVDEIERSCDMSAEPVIVVRLNRLYERLTVPVGVERRPRRVAERVLRGEGFTRVDMSTFAPLR